ncbi:MAG: type II toxin-antitoxin system RelE/ParE family toxin [Halioglobus sp.]|nr:type II toxin-antitoxin system RelE/ParE family toxin [Halioglobus sp.]
MGTYTLTNAARADLKSIATYTQRKWGKEQRRIYSKQFDDTFLVLAGNPETGISSDCIKQGYRKFPTGSHVIFFRVISTAEIQVVRILHKRMDVARQLGDVTPPAGDHF